MREPIRPDRRAASGRFCVWIEPAWGAAYALADDFASQQAASDAVDALINSDKANEINRIIVYDQNGMFKYARG